MHFLSRRECCQADHRFGKTGHFKNEALQLHITVVSRSFIQEYYIDPCNSSKLLKFTYFNYDANLLHLVFKELILFRKKR
jgi:hypothetical protein